MAQLFTPRPYQSTIVDHTLDLARAGVWAGMGLGKTVSTLTSVDTMQIAGLLTQPVLVIAPLRVAQSTWPDEVRKWAHLSGLEVQPIVGTAAARKAALRNRHAGVFTINYENLPWLIETLDGTWPFGLVVADEATKLKGFRLRQGGKRARALGRVAHITPRWVNLTGTPAPNGLVDLWGQTWFLDAGERLGRTFSAFTDRWFRPDHSGYGIVPLPTAQTQIEDRLRDICLSLKAEDYFDISEPIVNKIRVELPAAARALYQGMEKEMFAQIDGHEVEAVHAAAKTQKCLQLANGAAYIDDAGAWREVHSAKVQALESVIEEAGGMPVLVAYNFKSDLERLRKAFPRGRQLDADPQTIRDWNAGKIPVLFAHPASAGHGLNLQDGGNILAFFSVNWNLEEHQQIIERIGPTRQAQAGHDRPVFIHYILAGDTVDELVMRRLETKAQIQDLLLEAMKGRQQ